MAVVHYDLMSNVMYKYPLLGLKRINRLKHSLLEKLSGLTFFLSLSFLFALLHFLLILKKSFRKIYPQ